MWSGSDWISFHMCTDTLRLHVDKTEIHAYAGETLSTVSMQAHEHLSYIGVLSSPEFPETRPCPGQTPPAHRLLGCRDVNAARTPAAPLSQHRRLGAPRADACWASQRQHLWPGVDPASAWTLCVSTFSVA